jgi:prepilin signal peptidase PulO-like enzyme (type II secretory pathway)
MSDPNSASRLILLLAAGAIGASIGSFLNVCVYRIPLGLTVNQPRRSFCPSCGHQVEARDNIPVLSWLWLRGQCRYCKSQISIWYFLVELLSGVGTALAFANGGFAAAGSFLLLFSLLCIALRTRHSGHQPGALFLMGLICAVSWVLLERRITLANSPVALLTSVLGGFLIASHWKGSARIEWKQTLVVISGALVCGGLLSLILAAVLLLSDRFSNWSKRFAGLDDALLLAGVCAGPLMKF